MKKGIFFTFEGIDGAGKTVQIGLLNDRLQKEGISSLFTREPGGTPAGEEIRRLLLSSDSGEMSVDTEILLYAAARAQLVQDVLKPALEKDMVVVCDRYIHSTLAYQGFGAGGSREKILLINDSATGGLWPDLTIILDIDVEESVRRREEKRRLSGVTDRFEGKDFAYYRRVREGYLTLSAGDPSRLVVISSREPPGLVHDLIWEKFYPFLNGENRNGI